MQVLMLFKSWIKVALACQLKPLRQVILIVLSCLIVTTSYANILPELKVGGLTTISEVTKEQAELAMADMFSKQLVDLGLNISFKVYDTPEALSQAFDNKEIDAILASPVDVLAKKNQIDDLVLALVDKADKGVNLFSYVLVTNNINANSIGDLKGKNAVYVVTRSISKTFLDYSLLKGFKQESSTFFNSIKPRKDAQTAILDAFFGKVDAAIVDKLAFKTATELNPQIGKKLKVVLTSPFFHSSIICIRKTKAEKFKTARKALMTNPERNVSAEGVEIGVANKNGRGFGYTLQVLDIKDLAEVDALLKDIEDIKKTMK